MFKQNQGGFMREKFVAVAIARIVLLSAFSLSSAAYAQHYNFTLTLDRLRGKQAECGVIGSVGANGYVVQNWHVGRYIIVADNLVLTARAEMDNSKAYCGLGGINGVPGMMYLDDGNQGVGVGSSCLSQFTGTLKIGIGCPIEKGPDWPELGSTAISGGGPHGQESVVLTMGGNVAVPVVNTGPASTPAPIPSYDQQVQLALSQLKRQQPAIASSIVIDLSQPTDSLSLFVTDVSGKTTPYSPADIQGSPGALIAVARHYEVRFRKLPNIDNIQPVTRVEVRNGFGLDGGHGHFWLMGVHYDVQGGVASNH
jgi:hypothetical protein